MTQKYLRFRMIDFFRLVKDEKLADIYRALHTPGFDVNQKDLHGKVALHYALNIQIIRILIASGADVNVKR